MTAPGAIVVTEVDPRHDPDWDAFVRSHPAGRAQYLSAFARILRVAYRFTPRYLAARDATGTLVGVMPLVEHRGALRGARLESLPKARLGGPLARDRAVHEALVAAACERASTLGARVLRIRAPDPGFASELPGLACEPASPNWVVELPRSADELHARLHTRIRRELRRSREAGVTVRDGSGEADLRRFYDLFLLSMQRHHVLPPTFRQLAETQALLEPSGELRLLLAEHRGRLVGAALNLQLGESVDAHYMATDLSSRRELSTDHAIYWHSLASAIAEGRRRMDLSEAPEGSSLASFKRRWGAQPVPFHHYLYATTGPAAVSGGLEAAYSGQQSGSGRALTWLWERAPLRAVRVAGWAAQRYA